MWQGDILDQSLKPTSEAVESRLGDETVLLHLASGTYFGMDRVGTEIWEQLRGGLGIRAICAATAAKYALPVEQVESDARSFLANLIANSIVSVE